jgi:hypothetical protein
MTLLRSKSSRIFLSDNGSFSDLTEAARTYGTPSISHSWIAAEDAIYVGRPHKFQNFYCAVLAAGTGVASMTAEYWNGTAWASFASFLDESAALSASGFLQWEEKPEWAIAKPAAIAELSGLGFDTPLYWIKLKLSADRSGLSIRSMTRLLSDDRLLGTIFPELLNYLPAGQTDFLQQHELAFQTIVQELTASGRIAYAEQLKNVEDWILPATYKAIEIVLDPIVGDENLRKVKDDMRKKYDALMLLAAGSIDLNMSEDLDPGETETSNMLSFEVNRR